MTRATLGYVSITVAALLLAGPVGAELFTVRLNNGEVFQSRYQPEYDANDPDLVIVQDEMGNAIAIELAEIESVQSAIEERGFGRAINTTTLDLGVLPSDRWLAAVAAEALEKVGIGKRESPAAPTEKSYDQQQFVEPSQTGGGFAVGSVQGAPSTAPPAPR